ncbi:MAG TPA: CoA transferase [Acidimicrobiales bacterium]|nr:CoA transferase [Acidimicrobiales bacterium]
MTRERVQGPEVSPSGGCDERIVELSAFVAAPLAGMTLAALGCDVIRVDPPGGGLDFHRWPETPQGESIFWAGLNRGKRSVVIDVRRPEGRELVAALVVAGPSGDNTLATPGPVTSPGNTTLVGEHEHGSEPSGGCRGGVLLTNLGATGLLGHDKLRTQRADVITVAIEGRRDGRSAVDYTVAAGTGIPMLTGPEGHTGPVNSPLPAWDIATGLNAALAAREAIWRRRQTGRGTQVRLALADVALGLLTSLGFIDEERAAAHPRTRDGNYLYGAFGRDFELMDGSRVMVVAITVKQWRALVEALDIAAGTGELERSSGLDFSREGDRWQARHEIAALVERWCRGHSFEEVKRVFDEKGVCWGPYDGASSLLSDRGMAAAASASGLVREVDLGARFDDEAINLAAAPALGQHTEEALAGILGLSAREIGRLCDEGLVGLRR